jgi:hypothetical protein
MTERTKALLLGFTRLPDAIRGALQAEQAGPKLLEHREALEHHAEEYAAFLQTGDEERWDAHLRHLGRTRWEAGLAIGRARHRWNSCEGTPKLADGCDCYACDLERQIESDRANVEATSRRAEHARLGLQIHMTILLGDTP